MKSRFAPAVARTRAVAADHCAKTDGEASFPVEALTEMRDTRLLGALVPAECGGPGGGLTDMVDVTMELGRTDLSVALVYAMHCQQVWVLARYADERLRAHVLPAVANGRSYLASVTTEAGGGGRLLTAATPAAMTAGRLLVDRVAPIVTGGLRADGFLITMRTPDAPTPGLVDLVYADRDQLEVEVCGDWSPLGMRATESPPLHLRGAVPQWQRLGEPGRFPDMAVADFAPVAHLGWAAAWLGAATGAYSRVLGHIRSPQGRRRFDPGSELLLSRLAAVRTRLEVVHALLRRTVEVLETAPDRTAPGVQSLVNTLKVRASEECYAAVDELIEVVGLRHGYLTDSPLQLERVLRDLRSAPLNYANDRLRLAGGALALMDSGVHLA